MASSSDITNTTNTNPWSSMDEGGSPWDDVPSRSHSHNNLAKAAAQETDQTDDAPTPSKSAETPTSAVSSPVTSRSAPSKTRPSRRPVNLAQSTTLDPNDALGPLGPLGAEPVEEATAPTPPVKESASRTKPASRPTTATSTLSSAHGDDDASLNGSSARAPPPVQPPAFEGRSRQAQPSVSIEQAAKPSFQITVGDPHTVGGATSSHTVYAVTTKTTSKAYNSPTFTVTRRYRDFLWLYEQLHSNNPGVVVPPPPEKQTMGRFDSDFIEHRRQALERMVTKIAAHPVLHMDGDLKTFLESEAFNVDIKHKDRGKDLLVTSESKGIMSTIGLGGSGGGKFIEHDDWFHDRRIYLDALENQLKALQKSLEAVVAQRKSLAESCGEFSTSLHSLAGVELSPSLSGPLDALGDLQIRIQELYHRQAMQDILTLGIVIEEYVRLIGSVKKAFEQRQKAFHAWHSAETKLQDMRKQQDKLLRAGRSQQDRIAQMSADVGDAERRVHQARLLFEDMGRLMRTELDRFEREKVEDFKSGVETFLESAIEAQKELIELWETYLLQLDSDEDGPPLMPAGVRADADARSNAQHGQETSDVQREAENETRADTTKTGQNGGLHHDNDAGHEEGEGSLSGTTARDSESLGRPSGETAVHGDEDED